MQPNSTAAVTMLPPITPTTIGISKDVGAIVGVVVSVEAAGGPDVAGIESGSVQKDCVRFFA